MLDSPVHIKVVRMICEYLIDNDVVALDIERFIAKQNIHKSHHVKIIQLLNEKGICNEKGQLNEYYKDGALTLLKELFMNDDVKAFSARIQQYQLDENAIFEAIKKLKDEN